MTGLKYKQLLKGNLITKNNKTMSEPNSTMIQNDSSMIQHDVGKTTMLSINKPKIIGEPYDPDQFEELKKLGEGAYGTVFSVREKATGTVYVVKKILKDGSERSVIENEINILKILQNKCVPYILCYANFFA